MTRLLMKKILLASVLAAGAGPVLGAQALSVAPVEYLDVDTTYSTEAVVEAVRQSTISAQVMGRIVRSQYAESGRLSALSRPCQVQHP